MAEVRFGVRADTKKASGEMSAFRRKTVSAFDKIASKGKSAFSKLNTFGVSAFKKLGVAAVGLTGALALMIKTTADSGDKIGKLSTRLGISAEALSQYKFIASQTGVEFSTLTTAFQRLTRRVSEAALGTGVAKSALEELGISASALNLVSPEKQFEAITRAMAGVEFQSDKVRLAMKLFDTEGVSLLQTMSGGVIEINRMKREISDLGGVFTQVQVRQLEAFNDTMGKLGTGIVGVKNSIVLALVPSIIQIGTSMVGAMKRLHSEGAIDKWAARVAKGVINALGNVVSVTILATKTFLFLKQSIEMAFSTLFKSMDELILPLVKIEKLLNKIPFRKGTFDLIGLGEAFGDASKHLGGLNNEFLESASKTQTLRDKLNETGEAFKKLKLNALGLIEAVGKNKPVMGVVANIEIAAKQIDNFVKNAQGIWVILKTGVDVAPAASILDKFKQNEDGMWVNLKARINTQKAQGALDLFKQKADGMWVNLKAKADTAQAIKKIYSVVDKVEALKPKIAIDADTSQAKQELDSFLNYIPREIPIDIVIRKSPSALEKITTPSGPGSALSKGSRDIFSTLGSTRGALDINSLARGGGNDVFSLTQKIADLKIQAAALGTFGTRWPGGFNPDPTAQAQLGAVRANIKTFQGLLGKAKAKEAETATGFTAQNTFYAGGINININGTSDPKETAMMVRDEILKLEAKI